MNYLFLFYYNMLFSSQWYFFFSKIKGLHFESLFVICVISVYMYIAFVLRIQLIDLFEILHAVRSLWEHLFTVYSQFINENTHCLKREHFSQELLPNSIVAGSWNLLYYILTHFKTMFHFYTPLKTPENQRFSVVFREDRTLA